MVLKNGYGERNRGGRANEGSRKKNIRYIAVSATRKQFATQYGKWKADENEMFFSS